jgi:hypothetical protein
MPSHLTALRQFIKGADSSGNGSLSTLLCSRRSDRHEKESSTIQTHANTTPTDHQKNFGGATTQLV